MHDTPAISSGTDTSLHIAVIGMAGRFPGAPDIDRFWRNLIDGVESIRRWSREELVEAGLTEELIDRPDFVRAGAPLEDGACFDAEFFGYSPAEAEILDPQQRVFLECAWHALENAGYTGHRYKGAIGIYAASGINTYLLNLYDNARIRQTVSPYELFVSNDKDFLTTRAAFKLNLRGPAITVQTACSSSLVAVHTAVQGLLAGECDIALAGGVSLAWNHGYIAHEGSILSPDGHCRAFDSRSAGTVPGSGTGLVVLKRFDDAVADGDTIDAVILGSAINNDGALKASFTAPQVDSQAAVISDALAAAGIGPDDIGYIEAHGTGTVLGDPVEIAGLVRAFRSGTERKGFCALGSVKTNIGHLDTAAGIAGLIKTVLVLKHGIIPPGLHFEKPNPQIDFEASPFFVNTKLRPWDSAGHPRRAGVSSFGIGGTNAHVVLGEAPATVNRTGDGKAQLLLLSARNAKALAASASQLAHSLESGNAAALDDVAFTLREGRQAFAHRQWVVARDAQSAASALRGLSASAPAGNAPVPVLLFPGQGSQYEAMGKVLHANQPVFREYFDACATRLDRLLERDFRKLLFDGGEDIHRTDLAQPALFAFEYALAKTWMSFGLTPAALHGHSIGEYVAACIAGVFDLDTALALVVERGRLMVQSGPGEMLAVIHPDSDIGEWVGDGIALAAANAPGLSVVAGAPDAMARLRLRLAERHIASRLLKTSHAFHSPLMAEAAEAFRKVVAGVSLFAPQIPVISNLTGTWLTAQEATDPDYWARHMLETVRFEKGTVTLSNLAEPVFIEAGPGTALGTLTGASGVPSARVIAGIGNGRNADEAEQFLATLGRYWQAGGALQWPEEEAQYRRVPLPGYPFERERYWVAPQKKEGKGAVTDTAGAREAGLYRTSWRRAFPSSAPAKLRGRFLVFDEGQIGAALARDIERSGAEAWRVIAGERFDEPEYRCFTAPLHSAGDFGNLLDTLEERGALPEHILFLWPLTASESVSEAWRWPLSLLALVEALSGRQGNIRLTVVTQGAADVTGLEKTDYTQALLNGLIQVVGQEYPHLSCHQIDIDPALRDRPGALATRLREELAGKERFVALRGTHRWLPDIEPLDLSASGAPGLRRNGVYVVIGNIAEGVGKLWVDALARLPGVRLALVHEDDTVAAPPFDSLEYREYRLDSTDGAALGLALDAVVAAWGRIDGVFLGMAQSDSRSAAPLSALQESHLSFNERTRIAPVRALAQALEGRKAGFCCIQSSLSTFVGGIGLGAYSGACHGVELLVAEQNRKPGAPWFAIGYPLIEDADTGNRARRANAYAISPGRAWELTRRVIEAGHGAHVAISGGEVPVAVLPGDESAGEQGAHDGLRRRPDLPVPFRAPETAVQATVAGIFQELLGIEGIGIEDGFYELGGHSLLAIRAVAKLRDAFPVDVKMRELLFENPTVAAIAATIEARLSEETRLQDMNDLLDEIGSLSDDEVSGLLAGDGIR